MALLLLIIWPYFLPFGGSFGQKWQTVLALTWADLGKNGQKSSEKKQQQPKMAQRSLKWPKGSKGQKWPRMAKKVRPSHEQSRPGISQVLALGGGLWRPATSGPEKGGGLLRCVQLNPGEWDPAGRQEHGPVQAAENLKRQNCR